MTADEWISSLCEAIGVPAPDESETDAILRLASVAAHASERKAAPVACWIAGSSGRPLAELQEVAEGLAAGG
jgi:hypothetical protein